MPPHPLTNFEIQYYYQNESRFNGVYSRKDFPKIKDGAYVVNVEKYKSIGTYGIALHVNGDNATYFYRFRVEYIPKDIKKFIGNNNITTNIFKVKVYNSMMCG